jgi:hypothetical protein
MKSSSFLFFIAAAAVAIFVLSAFSLRSPLPHSPAKRKAVVVELFTSEGCSSCPPADDLLGHLRVPAAAGEVEVIPLGFHVDYWNDLGWQDRFSSNSFTNRQAAYTEKLRLNGSYTPQMVVDGTDEFVGSNPRRAHDAIAKAADRPERVEIHLAAGEGGTVAVNVKSTGAAVTGHVFLAITEDNLSTSVGAGENGGHVLRHAAVVREFRPLGQLKDGSFETKATVALSADWKLKDLRAVVLVQSPGQGEIEGAASVELRSANRH